ncbi:YkgJ family cysteine cluster protein [Halovivax limisalsi]|uniref:YkgJ family cysteine cluster protein n=1 Tax=Halovivax limisalsi TaxID=1453760 RepID=UPI001FFDBCFA|nr:YkgJ family cysteine cluster protein [Halovivax limisalsi]
MTTLEAELEQARSLSVAELADAIESIGFECTHCGACCRADPGVEACGTGTRGSGACETETHDAEACETGATDDESCDTETDDESRASSPEITEADPSETIDSDDAGGSPHTATIFPDEVRTLRDADDSSTEWRDVARPMPYGLSERDDGTTVGETFEWALQTDGCGDCTFYDDAADGGGCRVHDDRPLICRTYPFSVALGGTSQPMGDPVDREGLVRAHECEGLGRSIDREEARSLARALKERAVRELEEAIALTEGYDPADATDRVVVVDSEEAKHPDGTPIED